MTAEKLDKAIKVSCPIFGVSIGDIADKTTWRIDYMPEATAVQRWSAQRILDAFDWEGEAVKEQLVAQALAALDRTDMVALRCVKAGVSFPAEWVAYVAALRALVSSGQGDLPVQPSYPQGA